MYAPTDPAPPTPQSDNVLATLYRAALGPVNNDYYLPVLARFDARGRASSHWNWAASLCTLNWMALRRLWMPALAYLAALGTLALLVFALQRTVPHWPPGVRWGVLAALAVPFFVVPGLYGNALLHADLRRRIPQAMASARNVPEACALLAQQAPTPRRHRMLMAANAALAVAALLAWVVVPRASAPRLPEAALAPAVTVAQASAASASAAAAEALAAAAAVADPAVSESTPATATSLSASAPVDADTQAAADAQPASAPASISRAPESNAPLSAAQPRPTAPPGTPPARTPPAASAAAPAPAPATTPAAAPAAAIASGPAASRAPSDASPPAASPARTAPASAAARASAAQPRAPAVRAPESAASAAALPPAVGNARGYYINVGLFAEEANARKAQARLLNEGLPAFRQELHGSKGRRIRVRVGPYGNRAQAEAAAASIRAMELEAIVFHQR